MSEKPPRDGPEYANASVEHALLLSDVREVFAEQRDKVADGGALRGIRGTTVRNPGLYSVLLFDMVRETSDFVLVVQLPDEDTLVPGDDRFLIKITDTRAIHMGLPEEPVEDNVMQFCRTIINEAEWHSAPEPT